MKRQLERRSSPAMLPLHQSGKLRRTLGFHAEAQGAYGVFIDVVHGNWVHNPYEPGAYDWH